MFTGQRFRLDIRRESEQKSNLVASLALLVANQACKLAVELVAELVVVLHLHESARSLTQYIPSALIIEEDDDRERYCGEPPGNPMK